MVAGNRRHWLVIGTALLIISAVASYLSFFVRQNVQFISNAEMMTVHSRALRTSPLQTDSRLILVGITQETRQHFGALSNVQLRDRYADLLDLLEQSKTKACVFDLGFELDQGNKDRRFSEALSKERSMAIVLPMLQKKSDYDPFHIQVLLQYPPIIPQAIPRNLMIGHAEAFRPDGILRGIYSELPDTNGKTIRHIATIGSQLLNASTEGRSDKDIEESRLLRLGPHRVLLTRWGSPSFKLSSISLEEALEELKSGKTGRFRHSLVVVGDTSGDDTKDGPFGRIDGPEFIALSILSQTQIAQSLPITNHATNSLWSVLLSFFASCAPFIRRKEFRALYIALVVLLPLVLPEALAWLRIGIIESIGPSIACVTAIVLSLCTAPFYIARRASEEATVVFVDIKDFTPLTTRLGPTATRDFLVPFISELAKYFEAQHGKVERIIGDALLIKFKHRKRTVHVQRALEAVVGVQTKAEELASRLKMSSEQIGLRVGMEMGDIASGRIESHLYEEWSSYGPIVNLAARLQGECRALDVDIVCGPNIARSAPDGFGFRLLGERLLKGIDEPVEAFLPYRLESSHSQ